MLAAVRHLTYSFAETIICFSVSKLAPSFLQMWIISQVAQKLLLLGLPAIIVNFLKQSTVTFKEISTDGNWALTRFGKGMVLVVPIFGYI